EAGKWADPTGQLSAHRITMAGHQRRDSGSLGAAFGTVVWQTLRHQQRTEIGIADAEFPESAGILSDFLSWVLAVADQDFLGGKNQLAGVFELIDSKTEVIAQVFQQVDARQIAGRVIEVHVLAARVGAVDAAGFRRSVPLINSGIELHAGIGAFPSRFGDLPEQLARLDGLNWFAGSHRA